MPVELNFLVETTPNPAEVSFKVKVDGNQLNPDSMPTIGLPYNRISSSITNPRVNECGFGSYVYISATQEGGDIWLHFGKDKTAQEKNTPFRTSYSTRYYPWPGARNAQDCQHHDVPAGGQHGHRSGDRPPVFSTIQVPPHPEREQCDQD